ncbi:flavin-containing monooxygenase [Acinetobacter baumannii]|uniref:flavin-containing monooxygenase n=1 Tax=Acinetobacter baumannii TaxID=470 RepID=UPI0001AF1A63|nr:NAD(P)/FAD-dependent oxidoreductase [Acinetobacter baumannii]EKP43985.1 flavin-binding monooxygenase-like protein [Acinetobacter baumannii OIFC111]NJX43869.1 NAD(P)/FAD-dependent oxidoreductase [Acinetobacter baumannii]
MFNSSSNSNKNVRIAIIGTGFGGLGLAIRLKQAGFEQFTLFEKAADVGGVWRDNTYPGAACDVPSHLYSFSFEQELGWKNRYGTSQEIYQYLRHCADKYDLRPHIKFNTEIANAEFDALQGVWHIQSTTGEQFEAEFLVGAVGQLNRPAYPKLKGIENFKDKAFHSARWDHDYDLTGKRVAVIGTGASAIQFVPEIAKQVAHLDVYQRSAPYVIPKPDRVYQPLEKKAFRKLPVLQSLDRALQYGHHEIRLLAFTTSLNEMPLVEYLFQRHIRKVVKDGKLRHRLMPDYPIGCKRILISNQWYETLTQPHVDVINTGIQEITENGILDKEGKLREVDAIIYGTGFTATEFMAPMQITGLDGRTLKDTWKDGAEAYLGLTVNGFPNFFMLYGPNTNLGHNSIVYMIESQVNYILDALRTTLKNNLLFTNIRAEIQHEFNQNIQEKMKKTVWAQGCTSWYQTADGKNTNNWPGFTLEYRQRTRRFDIENYTQVSAIS